MKKKSGSKKKYLWVLLCLPLLALSGCGKTVDQLTKIGHDVIDIAGKVYEDVKDNSATVKDAVTPASPSK